jgi:pSer/pThr/pTyr-binding forkhead associated (FHA) protein
MTAKAFIDLMSDTKNIKVCPSCYQHNNLTADICVHCGAPLPKLLPSLITEPVPEPKPAPQEGKREAVRFTSLYKDIVAFVVDGQEQPILVKGSQQIVLGRYSYGEAPPTVDLTPYAAAEKGVSRHHARVTRRDDEDYTIEDMGSTNGTWLNKKRLDANKPQEIRSGDTLQLGQLILQVYFRNQQDIQSTEQTIYLRNEVLSKEAIVTLTPQLLVKHITPYLDALAGMQSTYNTLQQREMPHIKIASIAPDAQSMYIVVRLDGVTEALSACRGRIADWRTVYFDKVTLLMEMKGILRRSTGRLRVLQTANSNGGSAESIDALTRELRGAEARLTLELLNEAAPNLPEDARKGHVESFLPHVHVLAFSPFHIASVP